MPKRRTTKKTSVKPVSKPTEDSDDGSHPDNDKEEQKKMTLYEFDSNVSAALKDIKKNKSSTELALNKHFDSCISAIPSELRHLTLKEFAELGGSFEKALMSMRKAKIAGIMAHKCTAADLNINDQEKENEFGVVTELETVQRTIKGKRGKPRATKTPATSARNTMPLKTPAITPKFNPHLPVTPENIREIMPGERLMSMAGTPVRRTVARQQLEENLKESGVDLSPNGMQKILESLAATINIE